MIPCGWHASCWDNLICTIIFVPSGTIGWSIKIYGPSTASCADIPSVGLSLNIFNVRSDWHSRQSHKWYGKFSLTEVKPSTQWYFQVCIDHSSALYLLTYGGVICMLIPFFHLVVVPRVGTHIHPMLLYGYFMCFRIQVELFYHSCKVLGTSTFKGYDLIKFWGVTCNIMIYVHPLEEYLVNIPVWS